MTDLESLTAIVNRISSQEELLSIIESQQQQIENLNEELNTIRGCRRSWSVEWILSEAETMQTQLEELQRENRNLKADLQKAQDTLNRILITNE